MPSRPLGCLSRFCGSPQGVRTSAPSQAFELIDGGTDSHVSPRDEPAEVAPISPESRERRAIDPNLECITCGACYASCTMLAHDAECLGPAALNRAFTLIRDSRDGARSERLAAVGGEHGCWRCHSLFNCTEVCPKHLSPTRAIKGLQRAIVFDWLRSRLAWPLPASGWRGSRRWA
jgi:succinate dehydrogenase/fumarate reductase-like Fe-S protein